MRKKQAKPRKLDRKYRHYTEEALMSAYKLVKEDGMPVKRASKLFNVPNSTLRDRVSGRIDPDNFGPETLFTKEEEKKLVDHLKLRSELGYGMPNRHLQRLAGEMAFDLKKKSKCTPLSNAWLYAFLKRWDSEITSIKPRSLESARAKNSTPEVVDTYFDNLSRVVQENGLSDKPHRIFNIDETGLQPEHKPPNVIGSVTTKVQQITSPRSTTTTVIGCANAMGTALPPYFIFKGKRWNPDLMKGASVGAAGTMSDSGWVNGEIFKKYLEEHFLPLVTPPSKEDPILLIYDGHASHKNPETIRWAREKGMILFILPAHSSHLLQPLDVAIFGPFKKFYYSECNKYMFNHMGRVITKYDICSLASNAYLKAFSPLNIQAGFRKSGIYPLDKNVISQEQLVTCESFREKDPIKKVKAIKAGPEAVEQYLIEKEEKIQQAAAANLDNVSEKKERKMPNPAGRAITDDDYILALDSYENNKPIKNKSSKPSKKKQATKKKQISKACASPKPSTSGIQVSIVHQSEDLTDSDVDMEIADEEKCCVCGCFSPPDLKKCQYIKLVSWAQCGACGHWVHLAFCTEERAVRRQSEFLCPHCRIN